MKRLLDLSKGMDHSKVIPYSRHKSISSERTLSRNSADKALLKQFLLKPADEVAGQMRKSATRGRTITLKLKHTE
jgi:DNA polymerase-4